MYSKKVLLEAVVKAIQEDEAGISVVNPKRMREFFDCVGRIKRIFKGQEAIIDVIPHDEFPSVGTIQIIAKEMKIFDPDSFRRASALAHNYEIYPTLDGSIVLAFSFYNMTIK